MSIAASLITKLYFSGIFGSFFHTLNFCLKKELENCQTVLDLGCGPNSPIKHISGIKSSTGVEAFEPYLKESQKNKIHTKYVHSRIKDLKFPAKSFDAVIIIEVIEHLSSKEGLEIIKKAEKWARKKVIISSPNGFWPQKPVDNNPYQKHLSGWSHAKMKSLGYKTRGLAGFKFLRCQSKSTTMGDDILVSIRYQPKFFWFIIATLSQLISYYFPSLAFELFSVKNTQKT